MTALSAIDGDDLDIILPGTWVWIPLDDEEAMRKRVMAMVKRQVGVNDRLATRRRLARDDVMNVAKRARDAGALAFAMSLELAPGVPFPASLMMNAVDWPGAAIGADARERLAAGYPSHVILDQRTGPVAREAEFFQQKVENESTPTLRCEYRMPTPDGSRLLGITISAPTLPDAELFTELFDSIVDSITWSAALERVELPG